MNWTDGPMACTLEMHGGITVGQIVKEEAGGWAAFDYHLRTTARLGTFEQPAEAKKAVELAQQIGQLP